jgi:hypothetical protein
MLSLKLPPGLNVKLQRAAKERGETKSAIVRQALEQFLSAQAPAPQGSALEAFGRWVGWLCRGIDRSGHEPEVHRRVRRVSSTVFAG